MEKNQSDSPNAVKKPIPPYVKALSGSLGGIVEASCLQPIDVIKTRLQLDRTGGYRGIIHCGTTVARTEGVRALWKGLTPFATHLTLKYALRMGSNAVLQGAFKDAQTGKVSNHGRFISGFGAGVLEALVIVTPFEVVKIRLQQQRGLSHELLKYKGPVHCARRIIREEGLRGLWSGASPTVMRNGTNQAAMFSAKNAFDVLLWKKHEGDGRVLLPWQSMISGFLAGTAGPICTGPFDVVKTRLMAQGRGVGELKYKGLFHAIRTIYAEEGLLALWKGLLPRLMRIPPGQAIMWGVADQLIGLYEKQYLPLAPFGSGWSPISGHLCPFIALSLSDLTATFDDYYGVGLVALFIRVGKSHGGGHRVERFIHDGDPVSSSWLPPTIAGTGVTPMWLRLNIPEATEGGLLVGGEASGTFWLLWSEEICFANAIGYGGDIDLGSLGFHLFGQETKAKGGGVLLPAKLDAGGGISWAWALVHNWLWVSRSVWQAVCRFWAPICAHLSMALTAETMSVFIPWLVEWPSAILVAGEACWWVLGLLGPLVETAALHSSFGPGSLGSKMSIGSLYPFLN